MNFQEITKNYFENKAEYKEEDPVKQQEIINELKQYLENSAEINLNEIDKIWFTFESKHYSLPSYFKNDKLHIPIRTNSFYHYVHFFFNKEESMYHNTPDL